MSFGLLLLALYLVLEPAAYVHFCGGYACQQKRGGS